MKDKSLLLLLLLFLATAASAQLAMGDSALKPATYGSGVPGPEGPTGPTFVGGTLTDPLILDNDFTTCAGPIAVSFTSDEDLGFQRSAANTMLLCVDGVQSIQVNTTGVLFNPSGTATQDVTMNTDNVAAAFALDASADSLSFAVPMSSASVASGTPLTWRIPTAIGADNVTLPSCASNDDAGKLIYVDDTDDAIPGMLCVCIEEVGNWRWYSYTDPTCVDP